MNLLTQLLMGATQQGNRQAPQGGGAPASGMRTQAPQPIAQHPQMPAGNYQPKSYIGPQDARPFKMYEDMSFQGDPRQFMQQNPGYQFFEDNSFSAPQYPRVNPQTGYQSMYPGEENTYLYRNPQNNDNISLYREPGIQSIGGKIGQYGGTIGLDNGKVFGGMNRGGQPTDPMAELRRFLGL